MLNLFGLPLGTLSQIGTLGVLAIILAGCITVWIKGIPERLRVRNEGAVMQAKIEEDLRGEAAQRFKEFRTEVHGLRNELQSIAARLSSSEATSRRRADRLSMMAFILRLVMGELRRLDPDSAVLQQAEVLLSQVIEGEPTGSKSTALTAAEHSEDAAHETVQEVKAAEAKQ